MKGSEGRIILVVEASTRLPSRLPFTSVVMAIVAMRAGGDPSSTRDKIKTSIQVFQLNHHVFPCS